MKIEFHEKDKRMEFDDLDVGDGFMYDYYWYIKTAACDKDAGTTSDSPCNCIMYCGGWRTDFLPWNTRVEPVETKLLVYKNSPKNKSDMEIKYYGD